MKKVNINRRSFIKSTAILTAGTALSTNSFTQILQSNEEISFFVLDDNEIVKSESANWAIAELKVALTNKKAKFNIVNKLEDAKGFCLVVSSTNSKFAQNILQQNKIVVPQTPETLTIIQTKANNKSILLVAGTDSTGLVYALTELADRIKHSSSNQNLLNFSAPIIEKPASKTRSVLRNFSSELEDKPWFYDKDYWVNLLDLLVYSRINRLNFSTGMAYNSVRNISDGYMLFPYPFFINVPNYQVTAKGLSVQEQEKNLEILKFIGKETAKRSIKFQLGLWTLAYNWDQGDVKFHSPNATYKIEGLTDETHPDYCRDALAIILNEVPEISGVTFRVHYESGIAKGSKNFWETQFEALKNCGRSVEIDMHAKEVEQNTINAAINTKQPVVLTPKFCGEHMGLPYHQASIRAMEKVETDKLIDNGEGLLSGNRKFTRYGYADYLAENRDWNIVYRVWPGTQRFLLSGDPELFAGYGKIADFCGADGFEICEPLNFKGRRGTGALGGRCGYKDVSLNTKYDFEKYEYYYRTWGRLTYNPETKPEVWQRYLTHKFQKASLPIENALAVMSRVLPLFYNAHAPSANCEIYWPEVYENIFIGKDIGLFYDTANPKIFGNVSSMDPQLFQNTDDCGEAMVKGEIIGKYTPIEVAQWLEDIANKAEKNIKDAQAMLGSNAKQVDFRRIEEDVFILVGMAKFFASKFRSAVLWKVFTLTGNVKAASKAIEIYENGINNWTAMAERAAKVYRSDISFGPKGHWLERVPSLNADLLDLKTQIKTSIIANIKMDGLALQKIINQAVSKPLRQQFKVKHQEAQIFKHGNALPISLTTTEKVNNVFLHFRHVNQAEPWQKVKLKYDGTSTYNAEIPSAYTQARFPLQYYFEIDNSTSKLTSLYPALASNLANTPYFVVHGKTLNKN